MRPPIALAFVALMPLTSAARDGFTDHGVGAKVAEIRNVVTTVTKDGRRLVICNPLDVGKRGYVLVADIDSGETKQCFCPDEVAQAAPFGALMSRNGRFYTTQGRWLVEFDPNVMKWTFHGRPSKHVSSYLCFTESPDGVVWTGGAYKTALISFDPKTREMKDHGILDPKEHYLSFLAADKAGWIYAGIGTARFNIIAYNPKTGEKRQLVKEEDRTHGTGVVYPNKDGTVSALAGKQALLLLDGKGTPLNWSKRPQKAQLGDVKYGGRIRDFPDGRRMVTYDIGSRIIKILNTKTKETREIPFDYETEGATITSLAEGPKGVVYASSCHPMHLIAFDTKERKLTDLGFIPAVGGGNFCAMAMQGNIVVGAEYAAGRLWAYDVTRPFRPGGKNIGHDPGNPYVLAQWKKDICRPRTALAHPDGKHVMMAGFAGYGWCGGGIGIYNLETKEETLLTAEKDLLPGQSCITLKALPNGDLVGGTSVDAPGGGHRTAKEGELFILDWKTKKMAFHMVPVPGDGNIISIYVPPDGLVYGLSSNSTFFVFDPKTQKIVHSKPYQDYGRPPRHALQLGPDGKLYAMFSKAICRIAPGTFEVEKLATPPTAITAGGALANGLLVYAGRSHVWSYKVPGIPR
ncbi:MAG: hypothetical protein GXP25_05915 [Planctomycetes bacterium]|nr:hypothetical protein [Planctomycetota bacterium]